MHPEVGQGVPAPVEGTPAGLEQGVEHVLVPVLDPLGMGAGELEPVGQDVLPAPAAQIDEHGPGIEDQGALRQA
jgi:hypothetical protein